MLKNIEETKLSEFKKNLSNCVNVKSKTFYNKELILSYSPLGYTVNGNDLYSQIFSI